MSILGVRILLGFKKYGSQPLFPGWLVPGLSTINKGVNIVKNLGGFTTRSKKLFGFKKIIIIKMKSFWTKKKCLVIILLALNSIVIYRK